MAIVPGYDAYFSFSKAKLGYSGVCVYVKESMGKPACYEGITGVLSQKSEEMDEFLLTLNTPAEKLDAEGRCLILDFQSVVLFNIYFPNFSSEREEFIMDYYACVRKRIEICLKDGKEVVLVGDVNAVHEELDHCDPKESMKELLDFKDLPNRRWLDALVSPKGPLVDTTRYYHPNRKGMFTCWNTRMNARPANFGTRIDYILSSQGIQHIYSDIQPDIMGSDHCPVYTDFNMQFNHITPSPPSSLLTTQWPEFKQKKINSYFTKSTSIKKDGKISKNCTFESRKKISHIFVDEKQVADWNNLFQPREIPKCMGHNETCLERTVTKKGQNMGRVFYICSKPVGPQDGPKSQFKCNHFSWK